MTETLATLDGEVVTVAVHTGLGRAVAITDRGDVAALGFPDDAATAARLRAVLADLTGSEAPLDVAAGFAADRLALAVNWNRIGHGMTSATLTVDPETGAARELARAEGYCGFATRPVATHDGRFVLAAGMDEDTTVVYAYSAATFARHEVLRIHGDAEGIRPVLACQDALLYDPTTQRLCLVTVDPDNWEGNRILAVPLDADCRAAGEPEKLADVLWEPYSPRVGGACWNPFTGEVACVMYSSEWEGVVPVERIPQDGDPLPVADLHLARPDSAPRRLDVCGILGVNAESYDRAADAPHLPARFRFAFDFGGARTEVTPVVALGPDRYLVALFRGTLVALATDTGARQEHVHTFPAPVTALASGSDPGSVLVGLADGTLASVGIPSTGA